MGLSTESCEARVEAHTVPFRPHVPSSRSWGWPAFGRFPHSDLSVRPATICALVFLYVRLRPQRTERKGRPPRHSPLRAPARSRVSFILRTASSVGSSTASSRRTVAIGMIMSAVRADAHVTELLRGRDRRGEMAGTRAVEVGHENSWNPMPSGRTLGANMVHLTPNVGEWRRTPRTADQTMNAICSVS